MQSQHFVFYDLETSGLSPEFDQILQFAAIATTPNFEVVETVNLRCRLSEFIVPSVHALITTGVRPKDLYEPEMSEYDLAIEITKYIKKWSPCIFFGYNSINFDEKFLRHLFYHNLLPVYLTQNANNGRLDILKAVTALDLIKPGILKLGCKPDGKPDRKLETLAPLKRLQ